MIDITHKSSTLRDATAEAVVTVSKRATIKALVDKRVPKGDVLEAARVAGLLGVKKTPELIPDCHPLPIEMAQVEYVIDELNIHIRMRVRTIYKTGVEVEAMHGASVVALTIYDMLKPIDKGVQIGTIRLLEKKGGKSQYKATGEGLTAGVIVASDSVALGTGRDKSGKYLTGRLEELKLECTQTMFVPDMVLPIREAVREHVEAGTNLVIITGGTGASPRDVTIEAIQELITKPLPGIMEQARSYGQQRMPYAMLSASAAGLAGNTLVLALPGSTNAAKEYMDALFPHVLHLFKVLEGARHEPPQL